MTVTRVERKERTHRAILDAALDLAGHSTLSSLSLRQVAKEVGIVPTAFYRHFESIESLGLALVDESFVSLRALLREVRTGTVAEMVDHSVDALVEHVGARRAHFSFIARERVAGPPAVRAAISHEIGLCERELATDLARLPQTSAWSADDLRVFSGLVVTLMVSAAESILVARRPEQHRRAVETARTQLHMVLVGAARWRS